MYGICIAIQKSLNTILILANKLPQENQRNSFFSASIMCIFSSTYCSAFFKKKIKEKNHQRLFYREQKFSNWYTLWTSIMFFFILGIINKQLLLFQCFRVNVWILSCFIIINMQFKKSQIHLWVFECMVMNLTEYQRIWMLCKNSLENQPQMKDIPLKSWICFMTCFK